MARRVVQAQGIEYVFAPDDEPPLATLLWGLVQARAINDVTGRPVTSEIRLESDLQPTVPRIARDGLVGLVAVPFKVFPVLAGMSFTVNLTIHAVGYNSRTIAIVIPHDQRTTVNPLPQAGDRVMSLDNTTNLGVGEFLMMGNLPGVQFEQVQITGLGPGVNQVTLRGGLAFDHNVGPEPVVPVVPTNFGPTDAGDVRLVPQP